MNLQELKEKTLGSEELNELYQIEVELMEKVSELYKAVSMCETKTEQIEKKSDLTLANGLLGICRDRQSQRKDIEDRINYNFRMAAKDMLLPETYKKIYSKAHLPRIEVKMERSELRKNRQAI